jgi:putative hydrolase of the HAD superfamily
MLKGIFFDVDDTLYSTTAFADRARRNGIDAMIQMGLKVHADEAWAELNDVIAEFSSNYGNHYDKLLNRLPRAALDGTHPSLLVAAAVVAYHETKVRELSAYEDVSTCMRMLSATNLVLGIISAGLRIKQAEKLIRLGVWRYVNAKAVFITDEVGIGKPNPKLYLRACESVGLDPQECMYVGDHPVHDIDPANKIGMISVWNKREGRHISIRGKTRPQHVIYNFWDLIAILQRDHGFDFGIEL